MCFWGICKELLETQGFAEHSLRITALFNLGVFYPQGRDRVSVVQEAGWIPGPVWTGVENLALTGIRSPDRPARSESLYRLSYPGPRQTRVSFVLTS